MAGWTGSVLISLSRLSGCFTIYHTNSPVLSCVCLCLCVHVLLGESTAAVRINLHHGRAGAQWEWQSRTASSSGHVGEPIALKHNHNLTDSLLSDSASFLNQLSNSTLCISLFSFVITLYFLWLVSVVFLGLRSCSVSVMCVCFALKESCVFRSSLPVCSCFKTNLQLLPESCCSLIILFSTDSATKEENYIKCVHICSFGLLDFFFFFFPPRAQSQFKSIISCVYLHLCMLCQHGTQCLQNPAHQ